MEQSKNKTHPTHQREDTKGGKKLRRSKRQATQVVLPLWQMEDPRNQQRRNSKRELKLQRDFQRMFPNVNTRGNVHFLNEPASGLQDSANIADTSITGQVKQEAANPPFPSLRKLSRHEKRLRRIQKRLNKRRNFKPVNTFLNLPDSSVSDMGSSFPDPPVTEQIKKEAAKHVGIGKLKKGKRMKNAKRIRWNKIPTDITPDTELHVTEQIQLEAAKHLGAGKSKRKNKRMKGVKNTSLADVTPNTELHVTEQIKQEAAKHLGISKRNKKDNRMKGTKNIGPADTSLGKELHVTEQIKLEAAKHLDVDKSKGGGRRMGGRKNLRPTDVIPDSELHVTELIKQEAAKHPGVGGRIMRPSKPLNNAPFGGSDVAGSSTTEVHVTEQIKEEAAKHVGTQGFPRKLIKKEKITRMTPNHSSRRQKVKPARRFTDVQLQGEQSSGDGISISQISMKQLLDQPAKKKNRGMNGKKGKRMLSALKRLRSGKKEKRRPGRKFIDVSLDPNNGIDQILDQPANMRNRRMKGKKGKRMLSVLKRLRSGKKEKRRPGRKFIDVSLSPNNGINQASISETPAVKRVDSGPTTASTPSTGEKLFIPGLGLIDMSLPFEGIVQLKRKRRHSSGR